MEEGERRRRRRRRSYTHTHTRDRGDDFVFERELLCTTKYLPCVTVCIDMIFFLVSSFLLEKTMLKEAFFKKKTSWLPFCVSSGR